MQSCGFRVSKITYVSLFFSFPSKESLGACREQSKNSHSSSPFSVSEERGDGEGVVSHELSLLSDTRRCISLTDLTMYLGFGVCCDDCDNPRCPRWLTKRRTYRQHSVLYRPSGRQSSDMCQAEQKNHSPSRPASDSIK